MNAFSVAAVVKLGGVPLLLPPLSVGLPRHVIVVTGGSKPAAATNALAAAIVVISSLPWG